MMEQVYIFGHQNPDTDSICSAISYAYLKNQIDKSHDYIPVALKEANNETKYILEYFNMDQPKIVTNLKPQVTDINISYASTVKEHDSIRKTLETMLSQSGRILPVVGEDERLIGVVSISDIVPRMLDMHKKTMLKDTKTPVMNVITELDLQTLLINKKVDVDKHIEGLVYLSTDLTDEEAVESVSTDDIVVCNHSEWKKFVHAAGAIIIGGIEDKELIEKLADELRNFIDTEKEKSHEMMMTANIYISAKSAFELVKTMVQTTPISSMVAKRNLEYFTTYETIEDVKENMMSSKFKQFPVVDENGKIKGVISRSELVDINRKKAILVDHNERGQSIEGVEEVDILEIIDHHRVADVQTIAPLYFRVEPVGCTSTIVATMYEEHGVEIPRPIAGLMLSAIISDTLLFNSPTCTDKDIAMAEKLADKLGLNMRLYGMKMLAKGSEIASQSPIELLNNDRKKFRFGKHKVTISQMNSSDFDGFFKIFDGILKEMHRTCNEDGYDLFVLLVTDPIVGGTEIIAVGKSRWIVEEAFNMKAKDISMFLPGVFSRKKQIVPALMNAARL